MGRQRSISGTDKQRAILAILLIALFIIGDIIAVAVGISSPSHDTYPLGTWFNMPTSSSCGVGNTSASICELLGNSSYRASVVTGAFVSSFNVQLSVGCIKPSNAAGAALQLQYANYTGSGLHSNATNFVNVGATVLIDNSATWPCPGELTQTILVTIQRTGFLAGWIFRAVGIGGGGTGDNPRFSHVSVVFRTLFNNIPWSTNIGSPSTTGFTAQIFRPQAPQNSLAVAFNWLAVNSTVVASPLAESGTGSCTVNPPTTSCTQAITFGIAFAATPNIFIQITTAPPAIVMPLGSLDLLKAQTVTV